MTEPRVSIVVVAYRMSRQAENTLHSLSAQYQRNVEEGDYEIVFVENDSDDELGEARALAQGGNIRYFHRHEPGISPVGAVNFGFEQCRAPLVGLIIDGARMVTPRVVEHALLAERLADHPVIVVPGYHLGEQEHHLNQTAGYDESVERELLEKSDWKTDGYNLFGIACTSGANQQGFFLHFLESNCLFFRREDFEAIGRADPRFDMAGGGGLNIYIYHSISRLPNRRLIVLAGEGSFHQFHGGVSTKEIPDRQVLITKQRENLDSIAGGFFDGFHRQPLIFGVLPGQVQPFVKDSAGRYTWHAVVCRKQGKIVWPHDPVRDAGKTR